MTTVHDSAEPTIIYAPLEQSLQSGSYTVQWTAVSEDGHEITGSYQFKVSNQYHFYALGVFVILMGAIIVRRFQLNKHDRSDLPRKRSHVES